VNALVLHSSHTVNADSYMVAVGYNTLDANTTGVRSTGLGALALTTNTTGNDNTAVGYAALASNTTASFNTAVGYQALYSNTTAPQNTAIGYTAGYSVTTGQSNTYLGWETGYVNNGSFNTFLGRYAGRSATSGLSNTFVGTNSGYLITAGAKNTIIGTYNGNQGGLNITTSSNHIVLSDGDGNPRFFIKSTGLPYSPASYSTTTATAPNMYIQSDGAFYRSTSSQRYKNTINDTTHGLTELLTLRPVTYKGNNDGDTIFGGLIAEEVHDAGLTEFVQYNDDGEPDALAYGHMVSLCIKAIQELKTELDSAKARITALENG